MNDIYEYPNSIDWIRDYFVFFAIIGKTILPKIHIRPELGRWTPIALAIAVTILLASPALSQINVSDVFYPSGWLGDWGDITLDIAFTNRPHSGRTCIRITYSAALSQGKGWAGIYWQYPPNNWGNNPDFQNLTGATRLTFWARGENGGEKAEFKIGGITGKYPDSIQPPISTGVIVLSDRWQQYTIDLTSKDLSHVIGGFCWMTRRDQNPHGCTIYLDDIRYET